MLEVNAVLTSLNLSDNRIGSGGAKALASMLEVNAVLTSLNVGFNDLDEEAALGIVRAVRTRDKMTSLGLQSCGIGPTGAKEIAEYILVSSVLKTLSLI